MAQDPNWARWIRASITKWFDDHRQATSPNSYLFFEGQDRDETVRPDWAELRLMGPWMLELSKDYWMFDMRVNLFIACAIDKDDLYKIQRIQGIYAPIFANTIPVFRLGDGEFDDGTLMECLQLSVERNDMIQILNFGMVNTTDHVTRMEQSAIQAKYRMFFRIPLG